VGLVSLFRGLLDDAAMFPPGNASAAEAVAAHRSWRSGAFADLIGPLVVRDDSLVAVGREAAGGGQPLAVSVVNSSGAGGLVALARRSVDGLAIVAVESAVRDLDDLAGNAARVVSAAVALDPEIDIFVELPYAPGWERAVEVVEAAGLLGKIRTGGSEPASYPGADQLAAQLSILVEADLPFKATAGLHHAWPNNARNAAGETLAQHGFLNVLVAIDALVDGASVPAAAALLTDVDQEMITATVAGWNAQQVARVRRRFRSFGCCGVGDPIDDLVSAGLLEAAR
jgi:hypothetical protein